jgi:molecular chaperone DnaK (HSP70)
VWILMVVYILLKNCQQWHFKKKKKTAEDYLGQTVTEAVITVPAF